jgi:ribonuclease HI
LTNTEPNEQASPCRYSQCQLHTRRRHIFTDGSKSEQGVDSGVAVFTGKILMKQLKFKLDNRCSNNQAEQLAIVKALEVIESQQENHNKHRTAVIYTNSKITLDSIRSAKNHNHLVEEIRKRAVTLNKKKKKKKKTGTKRERNSRSTCEGGNTKLLCDIQQNAKKCH